MSLPPSTSEILSSSPLDGFDLHVDTLIIGAGACGLVAALAARDAGHSVLVVEADTLPRGSTALSAGLIPAAGTSLQTAAGIDDTPTQFAADIQAKAAHQNDPALVKTLTEGSAAVIEWLRDRHGMPFTLVNNFDYPGHTQRRMHGLPSRSGSELMDHLRSACESNEIDIVCERRAGTLHYDDDVVTGVSVRTPDAGTESIGCRKLILACNGFGGNRLRVARHLPDIADALWFGHDANQGDALDWGEALGAEVMHLGAYQGHGNVAHPHGILITWAVITEGGIQVNSLGERFWNESVGYSEAARAVLSQPGGVATCIFDHRIAEVARQFEDFRTAEAAGAMIQADSIEALAAELQLPAPAFEKTLTTIPSEGSDQFGRCFRGKVLHAPYCAVRVTGALFHTQGGLKVDASARVLRKDGTVFSNLFAGGGAACGVSGTSDAGYLSGNGLLSAVVLGHLAGSVAGGTSTGGGSEVGGSDSGGIDGSVGEVSGGVETGSNGSIPA